MDRVKAFFGAVEVGVQAIMSRSPGVVPDTGSLRFRAGGTLPAAIIADLVFYNGATEVVRFHDCILDDPREERSEFIDYVFAVKDRRWRWETPVLFGEYNVRDHKLVLIPGTIKTPRQLATLCLEALGETGFDVDALPTDPEVAPHVQWHYTSAAEALQKICDLLGVEVHLLNDNTIALITRNTGSIPDNTGLELPPETGLVVTPIPPYVTCFAGDTLFDEWLLLEPCGLELNGDCMTPERLSYRPSGINGWSDYDPDNFGEELYEYLKITFPLMTYETRAATVDIAVRTVFRMYRVVGFGFGVDRPVGYPEAMPLSYTNATDDKWRFVYIGNRIDDDDPLIVEFDSYKEAMTGMAGGLTFSMPWVLCPPRHTVFPSKLILPLEPTRALYGKDMAHIDVRRPPELFGQFIVGTSDEQYKRYETEDGIWRPWLYGFSINEEKGYVFLNRPCYLDSNGAMLPGKMYLRTGFGLRETAYGPRYHRHFNKPTGSPLVIANETIARTDLQQTNIRNYTADYKPYVTGASTNVTNQTEIDLMLQHTAEEHIKKFANIPAPQRKQYTPLRAIDTNGKVQQVTYSSGGFTFGRTVASIGAQYDPGQPTGVQKRREFLEKKRSEVRSKLFGDEFEKRPKNTGLLPPDQQP